MHVNTPYERFAWFEPASGPLLEGIDQVKPLLTGPFPIKKYSKAFETAIGRMRSRC